MKDLSCDEVVERLPALVVGDLSPEDERAIEAHNATCAECAQETEESRALASLLDLLAREPVVPHRVEAMAPDLRGRILAALPRAAAYDRLDSPVGPLYLVASDRGLCAVSFGGDEAGVVAWSRAAGLEPARDPVALRPYAHQLREYFSGERHAFDLPVDLSTATPFTRRVLEATARVPFGHLASYRDIARQIGKPGATRAVGNALGHNPVPIVIPCHRIVRSNGALGGYTGGLAIKRQLLSLEGVLLAG